MKTSRVLAEASSVIAEALDQLSRFQRAGRNATPDQLDAIAGSLIGVQQRVAVHRTGQFDEEVAIRMAEFENAIKMTIGEIARVEQINNAASSNTITESARASATADALSEAAGHLGFAEEKLRSLSHLDI